MSTIKVNKIENTATADGGIAIDASGHVTVDGQQLPTVGQLSNRNMVVNGAMQVSQRGTSFTHGTSAQYTLDRFQASNGSSFDWNSAVVSQSSDAPDGFNNSLKVDVASTSTPSGGENGLFKYHIEAQDLQRLSFGSSGAKSFTLSFWVKSNKTGTYTVQIYQSDADKYLLSEYSISSSSTWEHKTLTFVGNTADVIDNNTGTGFELRFNLACGSSDHTTAKSTWTAGGGGTIHATSNQVNLFDNASNEWYMTGVQLEVGEKATPFEHRSYGDELAKCQRYYEEIEMPNAFPGIPVGLGQNQQGRKAIGPFNFAVQKRAAPTIANVTIAIDGGDGSHAFSFPATKSAVSGNSATTSPSVNAGDTTEGSFTIKANAEL